jgi:hypothetical protein
VAILTHQLVRLHVEGFKFVDIRTMQQPEGGLPQ